MGGIPIGKFSGSDATEKLERTIIELNTSTDKLNQTMVRYTRHMLLLTIAMAGLAVAQLVTAIAALL